MLPAKDFLANLQSLFEQRFGFGIVAHILIKRRQIVQAFRCIEMLAAKDLLTNLQSLFKVVRLWHTRAFPGTARLGY